MATRLTLAAAINFAVDEPNSNWAVAADVYEMINRAYREAWDIIIDKYQDYATSVVDFTVSSSGTSWTLLVTSGPAAGQLTRSTFYKLRMLKKRDVGSGKYRPVMRVGLEETETPDNRDPDSFVGLGYTFLGDVIYFDPPGDAPGDYRAFYIPQTTDIANDTDVYVDPVNRGVEQYIIDTVSARLKAKDELDPSVYMALQQKLEARIARMAANRDAGRPKTVSDVRGTRLRFRTRF